MTKLFLLLLAFVSWSFTAVQAQCFWPDGSKADFSPCDASSNDRFSTCCGSGDMCTTNGFCKWVSFASGPLLWRDACSDPNWNSPNCAQYCRTNLTTGLPSSKYQLVEACSQTTYCCSTYNGTGLPLEEPANYPSCCNDPTAVFDAGVANYLSGRKDFTTSQFPMTATSTMSRSTTSTTTSSQTSTPTPSSSSPSSSNDLSTGAKAGIGIGAAVAAILTVALAVFFVMRAKRQRRPAFELAEVQDVKEPMLVDERETQVQAGAQSSGLKSDPTSELRPGRAPPVELSADRYGDWRELP